jgi:ribose transport system permease protein
MFSTNKERLDSTLKAFAPIMVLVVLLAVLGWIQPSFLSFYSLRVLVGESSVLLFLATGQTIVILFGGIDLSIAALASLASVLIALSVHTAGAPGLIGVLVLTTGIGAAQGYIHARAQVPSFVVTLAGLGLWSGTALVIAPATIPVLAGYPVVGWLNSRVFGVSTSFAFAVAALVSIMVMLRWLPFGRYVYAIGKGERAALVSGIPVVRVKMLAFALSGLFAGFAGMEMVARTHSGHPTIADALLLPCIAAVVVGGTAITGGSGGLGRTLVGVLIIAVLRVGIAVVGLDPGYEPLAYGIVVIGAVALTIDRSKITIVK